MKYCVINVRTLDKIEYIVPSEQAFVQLLTVDFMGHHRTSDFAYRRGNFVVWAMLFIKKEGFEKLDTSCVDFYEVCLEDTNSNVI